MSLLDLFRSPPAIADLGALEDFVDERAAFLVQKGVFEYARARSGIFWEKLFKEKDFRAAVDAARWRGYPIALGNIAEMVEGVLRPHAPGREAELLEGVLVLACNVMRRYPVPPGEAATFWREAEDWMRGRLSDIQLRPPKPVKDVPLATARQMFDLMPIHASLRGEDFVVVRNHLRSNLCRIYGDFAERAALEALLSDLLARRGGNAAAMSESAAGPVSSR